MSEQSTAGMISFRLGPDDEDEEDVGEEVAAESTDGPASTVAAVMVRLIMRYEMMNLTESPREDVHGSVNHHSILIVSLVADCSGWKVI